MQEVNTNGKIASAPGPSASLEARADMPRATPPRVSRQARFAQAFSGIVAVLMRDPQYRDLKIASLEYLVVPAVLSGQWRLAHAPVQRTVAGTAADMASTPMVPLAAVLWANVSDGIDKRLSENLDNHVALKPNEWVSGSNLWLIAIAGDRRAISSVLKQLRDSDFKDRKVKVLSRGADGKTIVETLDAITRESVPPRV